LVRVSRTVPASLESTEGLLSVKENADEDEDEVEEVSENEVINACMECRKA
jgi:hypothetical protein